MRLSTVSILPCAFQDGTRLNRSALGRTRFLLVLLILLLPAVPSWGARVNEGEKVSIDADSFHFDQERKLFVAVGNVHFTTDTMTMSCDYAEYSDETGDYSAAGNVVFRDEEGTVLCERVEGNVLTHRATFYKAVLDNMVKDYLLKGDRIDKVGEESYHVERGSVSECGKERPFWEIGGKTLQVTKGEYVTAKNMTLRLGGVPVFFSPYFLYPLKTTRQSGFLPPLFGSGGRNGSSVKIDYFWAMDTNRDATLTYEYLGDNGNRFGLEYRYALSREIRGAFFGRYIHDRNADREGSRIGMNEDRWEVGLTHYHNLEDHLYGGLFMDVFSDGFYQNDFSPSSEARVRNNGQSDLTVVRRWSDRNLSADFRYYQELGRRHETTSLQSLPEIRFDIPGSRVAESNWFYALDSSIVNFYRKEEFTSTFSPDISSDPLSLQPLTAAQNANLQKLEAAGFDPGTALRYQGIRGRRLDLFPSLSLPLDLTSSLVMTPNIGYRETFYNRGALQEDFVERGVLNAGLDLDTRLYHDFRLGQAVGIRHILEPRISYSYRPKQGQEDIPIYDEIDRIDPVDEVHLKLINRVIVDRKPIHKEEASAGEGRLIRREIATLKLDGLYDRLPQDPGWRNVTGELDLNLSDLFYVETNSAYNFQNNELENLNFDFKFRLMATLNLQLGRRYTKRIPIDPNRPIGVGTTRLLGTSGAVTGLENEGISFWTAHLGWEPTKALSVSFSGYFNARSATGDDESLQINYEKKCWGLSLTAERYDDTVFNDHTQQLEINPVNELHLYFTIKSFRFRFYENVAGIGKVF
jgi:LPS-assembly protein